MLRTLLHVFRGSRLPQPVGSTPLLKRTPTLGRARTRVQIDRAIRPLDDLRYARTGPEAAAPKPYNTLLRFLSKACQAQLIAIGAKYAVLFSRCLECRLARSNGTFGIRSLTSCIDCIDFNSCTAVFSDLPYDVINHDDKYVGVTANNSRCYITVT